MKLLPSPEFGSAVPESLHGSHFGGNAPWRGVGGCGNGNGAAPRDPSEARGTKFVHCVEVPSASTGSEGSTASAASTEGVVVEWATRRAMWGARDLAGEYGGAEDEDVQELLIRCRVGRFPSQRAFYLLVSLSCDNPSCRASQQC